MHESSGDGSHRGNQAASITDGIHIEGYDSLRTSGGYFTGAGPIHSAPIGIAGTGSGSSLVNANGQFDIAISYSGSATYQYAFTNAAARWSQIIIGDIPDVNSGPGSGNFGFIDDLLIRAVVTPIDGPGGILGQAGPDWIRTSSKLPYHGVMFFDSADVASMHSGGTLTDVVLHEMGHVLGFGTLWSYLGLSSGIRYTGAHALTEYRSLTGDSGATFVPLENGGGPGTAYSHWEEQLFDNELMTGYLGGFGSGNPISRTTIGALQDLGYTVNYAQANAYSLRDDLASSTATTGAIAVGGKASGWIETANDEDWFRVTLTAGHTYQFDMGGSPSNEGTLSDAFLVLRNSSGAQIDTDDDSGTGLNAQITYTPSTSGTYYLDAQAYTTHTGSYRLSVVDKPHYFTTGSDFTHLPASGGKFHAYSGNDSVYGAAGRDIIYGDNGNDRLIGDLGNDVLNGGRGRDLMWGGSGADDFDFDNRLDTRVGGQRDIIMDFHRGSATTGDDIDLRTIDAKTTVGGNQAFRFIAKQPFHHKAGELHYTKAGANVIVAGDVNGDAKADFEILVKGVAVLSAGDFLL